MKSYSAFCLAVILSGIATFSGCATDLIGEKADLSKVETPTGLAIHPNGRYAYVAGSNFNLEYRATDGGAIYVVDLETNTVLKDASKRIGSFATNIVLSEDGKHGYTVTRDDDALVWFEISEDGSRIFCPEADEDSESLLDCRIILDDDPTHIAITRSYREQVFVDVNGIEYRKKTEFDLLMIAQLRNARVSAVTVRQNDDGKMVFSHQSAAFVYSASEVLWIGGERFIVTGRAASNLLVITPAISAEGDVLGLYASQGIVVPTGSNIYQGRGMTLDPSGNNMYLLNQYPNSLLKFDVTGLAHNDSASDRALMTNMITLPYDMLKLAWIGGMDDGYLYLTSVVQDSIYIVDPRQMEIKKVIPVGDGPYELVKKDNDLFVVNFLDQNISKFDVSDPLNPVHIIDFLSDTTSAPDETEQTN
ncbi:MAG: hypothetical protein IJU23_07620 [Proteobacteria bacterium]|nr:hypothetical protein [Pseudomonadota bacterium]